jgi:hypothetical protein
VWDGHTTGAIYLCTAWPARTTGDGYVWLAAPPTGQVNPAVLAQRAAKTLVLPQPSGHRSPSESQRYQGFPLTYVNLWTFYWSDPGTWHSYTAKARAGGVSATVTATPTKLTFDPGDGNPAVACPGPGRAWTSDDGNSAPSGGACGYRYTEVSSSPLTSTQSIVWAITWTGTGGTGGTLPDVTTTRSGQLNVLQIQSVVTR